ncbi:MAG: flagellar biosynthesis anti-sigma factor FlgM [Planctomycetes bacterium]|nr:flagellar biosynthesis anti-sigma factor FlgM [Planctomycetota bacterium]
MNDTVKQGLDTGSTAPHSDTGKAAGKKPRLVTCSRKWIEMVHELPDVREDLVGRVRSRIANGFYEEAECLDIAIDRFLDDADEVAQ